MLRKYETDASEHAPAQATAPAPMAVDAPSSVEPSARPLEHLTVAQLKTEIGRLEKHLLDLPPEAFQPLRDSLEEHLQLCKAEIQAKRPPGQGQTLDKAIARQRQTARARQNAEEQVLHCQQALTAAQQTLAQATKAEEAATAEVTRVRQQITETDVPDPQTAVSCDLASRVGHLMQEAGHTASQVLQVISALGHAKVTPAPPPPPLASAPPLPSDPPLPGSSAPPPGAAQAEAPVLQHLFGPTQPASAAAAAHASPAPRRKLRRSPSRQASHIQGVDSSPDSKASRSPRRGASPTRARRPSSPGSSSAKSTRLDTTVPAPAQD